MVKKNALVGAAAVTFVFVACSGETGTESVSDEFESTRTQPGKIEDGVGSGSEPPDQFIDSSGSRYVLVGESAKVEAPMLSDGRPAGPKVEELPEEAVTSLENETVESLASKLRGYVEIGGYEYMEVDPPMDLARAMLEGVSAFVETPASADGDNDDFREEDQIGRKIIEDDDPDDDRGVVRNNTSNPWRTIVHAENGCSGTLISPTTIVTAAHCVYNTTTNAYIYVSGVKPQWGRGADAGDATTYPYGQFSSCYTRYVTQEWKDTASNGSVSGREWDFAAIKLGCSQSSPHWLGTWTASESTIEGRTTYVYGYPAEKSPYPQIWGTGVTSVGTYVSSPSNVLKHYIDTTGGQSGSAIYLFNDSSQRRLIGIHRGAAGGENRNVGRRWDSYLFNWVDSKTNFPEDI